MIKTEQAEAETEVLWLRKEDRGHPPDTCTNSENSENPGCGSGYLPALFYLCQVQFLAHPALATVFHAMVISKLDYDNLLYLALPLRQTWKLQPFQNTVVRALTGTPLWEHIQTALLAVLAPFSSLRTVMTENAICCLKCNVIVLNVIIFIIYSNFKFVIWINVLYIAIYFESQDWGGEWNRNQKNK